ncbi:hypothetical protein BHU72_11265 [Desulfuribacillus stibiiarsenatis]|uniref:Copper amine oxidase-like N-terminal domain-containing protein n=1 Tax=Desulfuribacillus stibiiarsenatis TaxID=1390249 RepID=A0A1E5L2I4_9FIRM|nr:stalk domain-containing protein [Desulfuribacillus stibiiarsenatis]OEH84372.1 hypothetical protein BHU72_11265 [Desulfuribacillus stibiiarsenatis]
MKPTYWYFPIFALVIAVIMFFVYDSRTSDVIGTTPQQVDTEELSDGLDIEDYATVDDAIHEMPIEEFEFTMFGRTGKVNVIRYYDEELYLDMDSIAGWDNRIVDWNEDKSLFTAPFFGMKFSAPGEGYDFMVGETPFLLYYPIIIRSEIVYFPLHSLAANFGGYISREGDNKISFNVQDLPEEATETPENLQTPTDEKSSSKKEKERNIVIDLTKVKMERVDFKVLQANGKVDIFRFEDEIYFDMQSLAEYYGKSIAWDDKTKEFSIRLFGVNFRGKPQTHKLQFNNATLSFNYPIVASNNRVYIPSYAFSKELGGTLTLENNMLEVKFKNYLKAASLLIK